MDTMLTCLTEWLSSILNLISTILPPDVRGAFVGAIVGAVGAYWVSQKTLRNERVRKRWFEHRNYLVELEHLLNEMIDMISGNKYISNQIISLESISDKGTFIAFAKPNQFPTNLNHNNSLLRIKLKNCLFSYATKIRRTNGDIKNINQAYIEMTSAFLSNNISPEQYLSIFKDYKDNNLVLITEHEFLENQSIEMLAHVRVAMDKDRKYDNLSIKKLPKLEEISDQEIQTKIKIINDEIENVAQKSREKLEKHGITKRRNC